MPQKVRIELNSRGIRELLKSEEVRNCVLGIANEKAKASGDGYEADAYETPNRVISSVYAETADAMQDNLRNNTLLKVLSGS